MYADKILINGKIYTENKDMMWAEAVAVKGSRFICVGKNEECMKYRRILLRLLKPTGM